MAVSYADIVKGKSAALAADDKTVTAAHVRHGTLRGVDSLWLLLERATAFSPVCTSTYTFDREVPAGDLRDAFRRQCQVFPKYRQRLAFKGSLFQAPYYEDDPAFSLDRHFEVVELPSPAGPEELNDFVSQYISQPWDETKPLWGAVYIPNYRDDVSKAAMVSRGHHTQADGQGFIMSALYITSFGKDLQRMMDEGEAKLRSARRGTLTPSEVSPMLRQFDDWHESAAIRPFIRAGLFFLYWTSCTLEFAERVLYSGIHLLYTLFFYVSTIWRIELIIPTPKGSKSLKGPRREAVFALSRPVPLKDVKTIQRAFSGNKPGKAQQGYMGHVTVNDVLCSIMADCVSRAIERKPRATDLWSNVKRASATILPMPIAFFIPISVRDPGQWDMRNLSTGALAYLGHLPQAQPSAWEIHRHIHKSKRSLNICKKSYLPYIAFQLFQYIGAIPFVFYPIWSNGIFAKWPFSTLKEAIFGTIISSMPAILTNIAGPPEQANLAGGEVLQWTAAPPTGGHGVLAIGVISYANNVLVTCHTDKVPEFEDAASRICHDFEERFKLYLNRAEDALSDKQA